MTEKYFQLFSVDAGIRKKNIIIVILAKDRLVSLRKIEIVILVKYVAAIVES